ncbi:hypothetical protein E2C01_014913 [Portunus trituberculatus]|uniref:Uncharacterized protein n=1 Tax=Portunus trituberculatus TaxID=210409 RepID=A0A5B7DLF0_PORTR|nr:hypothetical protein [Portunus trituberculatus]
MSSCPSSFFCHQLQVLLVCLFNAINSFIQCYWVGSSISFSLSSHVHGTPFPNHQSLTHLSSRLTHTEP